MLQNSLIYDQPPESPQARAKYPGFRGGICKHPIRYRHRWHRDLLLQAALNPTIDAMMPAEVDVDDCLAFEVRHAADRMLIVGVDGIVRPVVERAMQVIFVTRATILADPIASDARAVWATRHHPVGAADRIRILAAFERSRQIRLCDLAALARVATDGIDTVLAMACSGELAISLSNGVHPEMDVRRRRLRAPFDRDACP